MSMTLTLLLTVQILSALSIIMLVLLQQGKGADMGSSFGSGSAGSLFGATGAANFLSRATKWAAIVFFVATGSLAYLGHQRSTPASPVGSGVMQEFDRSVPSVPTGSTELTATPTSTVPQATDLPSTVPAVPQ